MIKIILFGSNGFIGENIYKYFSKIKEYQVYAPSRKECDLLKTKKVKDYIKKINPEIIINAAYIEVNSNVKPTRKYLNENLKIPLNILKASKNYKNIKRIIFFGSGLEYGDSKKPIDENHKVNPKNYYAYTKVICSQESFKYAKKFNLPLILIRPFNLYGPFDNKSVIHYLIKSTLENKEISATTGEQIRDFMYIEDLINLMEKVVINENIKNLEIFNAGFGKGISLKNVTKNICKINKFKKKIKILPYRKNEYFYQIANINKAKKLLKWEPKTTFKIGIKKTIDWIKAVEL